MDIDVFISYKHDLVDAEFASELVSKLSGKGVSNIWWDKDIQGSENWGNEISNALEIAKLVVLIISPRSMESAYITYEWCFAHFGLSKRIYPIHLVKCGDDLGVFGCLRKTQIQWKDVSNPPTDQDWENIISEIQDYLRLPDEVRNAGQDLLDVITTTEKRIEAARILGNFRSLASRNYLLKGLDDQTQPGIGYGPFQREIVHSLYKVCENWDKQAISGLCKLLDHTRDADEITIKTLIKLTN